MFQKRVVIDGKGHLLGRLASVIAKELLNGQEIVVVRCEAIDISGTRHRNRKNFQNYLQKRTNTNPKWGPFHHRAPRMILTKAVRGMLPRKTHRGELAMARLKAYEGIPPTYAQVKRMVVPDALRITHLRTSSKYTNIGVLAGEMGWKYGQLIRSQEQQRKIKSAQDYEQRKELAKLKKKAVENADLSDVTPVLEAAGY
ncbi:Ribosomal protein L13 [Gracilaria domingensis]|nr:Ribosomal protein L13 [Gracilaria domingensis]